MIIGLGTDIIDIPRITMLLNRESFLKKIYTDNEIAYLKYRKMNQSSAAGMFAAKEAVAKALGRGFDKLAWREIEILHDEFGRPYVVLHDKAKELADGLKCTNVHISISHERFSAIAQCILENRNG